MSIISSGRGRKSMYPEGEVRLDPSHPRYKSLLQRERLVNGFYNGIVVPEGLIAHGRGEMFDYVLGEETTPPALKAEKAAAAAIIVSENPVISVNGNLATLCSKEVAQLSKATGAKVEVNLFHWSEKRAKLIRRILESNGAKEVLAEKPDIKLEGIRSIRGMCHKEGIFSADTVLIPLEDGDRALALADMGKTVISLDLNPLSRTSLFASISIVDEVTRAMPNLVRFSKELAGKEKRAQNILKKFDNASNLCDLYRLIGERFDKLGRY